MMLAIIHTASGELRANRMPAEAVESALVTTVLGALGARPGRRLNERRSSPRG